MLLITLLTVQLSIAQINISTGSNLRNKKISTTTTSYQIEDTLSLIANTIKIKNVLPSQYIVDEINATITWIQKPAKDSVDIQYRVYGYKLNAVARHFNYEPARPRR